MEIIINYCKSFQPFWEIIWNFLIKLKIDTLCGKVILLLVTYAPSGCMYTRGHLCYFYRLFVTAPNYNNPQISFAQELSKTNPIK